MNFPISIEHVENIVYKVALKHSQRGTSLFDELIGEGMVVAVEAVNTFDREKGTYQTHLYWCLMAKFKEVSSKFYRYSSSDEIINDWTENAQYIDVELSLFEILNAARRLSEKARQIIFSALCLTKEVAEYSDPKNEIGTDALKGFCRDELDISHRQFYRALKEIKGLMAEC